MGCKMSNSQIVNCIQTPQDASFKRLDSQSLVLSTDLQAEKTDHNQFAQLCEKLNIDPNFESNHKLKDSMPIFIEDIPSLQSINIVKNDVAVQSQDNLYCQFPQHLQNQQIYKEVDQTRYFSIQLQRPSVGLTIPQKTIIEDDTDQIQLLFQTPPTSRTYQSQINQTPKKIGYEQFESKIEEKTPHRLLSWSNPQSHSNLMNSNQFQRTPVNPQSILTSNIKLNSHNLNVQKEVNRMGPYLRNPKFERGDLDFSVISDGILTYYGQTENQEFNGFGVALLSNGAYYEGYWKNNKPNFSGRIIHDDCESFEGDWENGIAQGGEQYFSQGTFKKNGLQVKH